MLNQGPNVRHFQEQQGLLGNNESQCQKQFGVEAKALASDFLKVELLLDGCVRMLNISQHGRQ